MHCVRYCAGPIRYGLDQVLGALAQSRESESPSDGSAYRALAGNCAPMRTPGAEFHCLRCHRLKECLSRVADHDVTQGVRVAASLLDATESHLDPSRVPYEGPVTGHTPAGARSGCGILRR